MFPYFLQCLQEILLFALYIGVTDKKCEKSLLLLKSPKMYSLYVNNNVLKNLSATSVDTGNYFVSCARKFIRIFFGNSHRCNIFDSNRLICLKKILNFTFIIEEERTQKQELNPVMSLDRAYECLASSQILAEKVRNRA